MSSGLLVSVTLGPWPQNFFTSKSVQLPQAPAYNDQFHLCIRSKQNVVYSSLCVVHISSSTLDIKRLRAGADPGFTRELHGNEENCYGDVL